MGTKSDYSQIDNPSCKYAEDGSISATSVVAPRSGVKIETLTVGTPENFVGTMTVKSPSKPHLQIPFYSTNLGEGSMKGKAAAFGKFQLQKCFGDIGPSF